MQGHMPEESFYPLASSVPLSLRTMRVVLPLLLATAALAAPEGRNLRPEEHWRPAGGRDLSKYKVDFETIFSAFYIYILSPAKGRHRQ